MFSHQKDSNKKRKSGTSVQDTSVTILTSGCHFNGKLHCRGSSRIGGKIEGQVVSEGLLIIEEDAVIAADIRADEAVIQGRVRGKLEAAGRVELCASSRFDGDISSPVLVIHEGAQFNGRSTMVPSSGGKKVEVIKGESLGEKMALNQAEPGFISAKAALDEKAEKAPIPN